MKELFDNMTFLGFNTLKNINLHPGDFIFYDINNVTQYIFALKMHTIVVKKYPLYQAGLCELSLKYY